MTFHPAILLDNWRDILDGMALTILIWVIGTALGLVIGLVVAVLQLFTNRFVAAPLTFYVALMRGTPFLIQLFIIYYGGAGLRAGPDGH